MRGPTSKPANEAPTTMQCSSCGNVKSIADFLPSKFTSGGVTASCKICIYARARGDRKEREAKRTETLARKRTRKATPRGVENKT